LHLHKIGFNDIYAKISGFRDDFVVTDVASLGKINPQFFRMGWQSHALVPSWSLISIW
jgi:hypothetical protein